MIKVPIRNGGNAYFSRDSVRLLIDRSGGVENMGSKFTVCEIVLANGSTVTSTLSADQVFELVKQSHGPAGGTDLPLTAEQQAWWRERLGIMP